MQEMSSCIAEPSGVVVTWIDVSLVQGTSYPSCSKLPSHFMWSMWHECYNTREFNLLIKSLLTLWAMSFDLGPRTSQHAEMYPLIILKMFCRSEEFLTLRSILVGHKERPPRKETFAFLAFWKFLSCLCRLYFIEDWNATWCPFQ